MKIPRPTETFIIVLLVTATSLFLVARNPPQPDPFSGDPLAEWGTPTTRKVTLRYESPAGTHRYHSIETLHVSAAIRELQEEALTAGWSLHTTAQATGGVDYLSAEKTLDDGTTLLAQAKPLKNQRGNSGKVLLLLTSLRR